MGQFCVIKQPEDWCWKGLVHDCMLLGRVLFYCRSSEHYRDGHLDELFHDWWVVILNRSLKCQAILNQFFFQLLSCGFLRSDHTVDLVGITPLVAENVVVPAGTLNSNCMSDYGRGFKCPFLGQRLFYMDRKYSISLSLSMYIYIHTYIYRIICCLVCLAQMPLPVLSFYSHYIFLRHLPLLFQQSTSQ